MISHILENSSLVKPLLHCFFFFFTVPPSSACFLFVCFDVFTATSQHCQQTRDILVFWANVWVYKEVWGNVSSFHIWSPIASLYTVSEHIDTFPTCPINLHFSTFLVLPKLSGAILHMKAFTL